MSKTGISILSVIFLSLVSLSGYLVANNLYLSKSIRDLSLNNDKEFTRDLNLERELIRKELNRQYRSEMVSFENTAKSLEKEKNRNKELKNN